MIFQHLQCNSYTGKWLPNQNIYNTPCGLCGRMQSVSPFKTASTTPYGDGIYSNIAYKSHGSPVNASSYTYYLIINNSYIKSGNILTSTSNYDVRSTSYAIFNLNWYTCYFMAVSNTSLHNKCVWL